MTRIAQLIPHTAVVDGIQRAALDLTRGLAELGHRSLVMSTRHGENLTRWKQCADVVAKDLPELSWNVRKPHRAAQFLALRVPGPFDVVIAHRLDLVNAAAVIGLRSRAPVILHAHNAPPEWLRWGDVLRVPGSRRVSRVIVASEFMLAAWREVLPAHVDIRVVEYPIDTDHFTLFSDEARARARRILGVAPDAAVVGYVGRLEHDKGVHVLAQAACRLAETTDLHVLIQGAPNLGVSPAVSEAYAAQCESLFGGVKRSWLPPSPDVRHVLAAADVMVVPSVWQEPSGLTVSEALATATPVVASRVGGIPAQMPDSPCARLVSPSDGQALVATLSAMLQRRPTPAERFAMRQHVVTRRSLAATSKSYYSALMGRACVG